MLPLLLALHLVDAPCAGCRVTLPDDVGQAKTPLLVVLHGDFGAGATAQQAAWEKAALAHGVGVLALQCPVALGCKGSWWQWNGDPAWLGAQVDALAKTHPIDRDRVWIAGWSGGASYLGLRAPELAPMFAAVVYHGGGIPWPGQGCEGKRLPSYFLVGDGNPLHGLAVRLRDEHLACHDDVTWKLVPGADHDREWKALATNAGTILDWLLTKKR